MEIKKDMDEQYEKIMLHIKKRFLEKGLHPDLVAGATHTKPFERRFPRSHGAKQVQEELGLDDEDDKKGVLGKVANAALDKYEKKNRSWRNWRHCWSVVDGMPWERENLQSL